MLTLTLAQETPLADMVSRRGFLQVGALTPVGLSLPQLMAAKQAGLVESSHDDRACIMIFNVGAPSHLDTLDMKPDAPVEIRGPFKPIRTTAPGMHISEILPLHAEVAEHFSLVRSCYHTGPAVHDVGWQAMQTGQCFFSGPNPPHVGSVLSYTRGRKTDLPAFCVVPSTMGRGGGNLPSGQSGGWLGPMHDPTVVAADPAAVGANRRGTSPTTAIPTVRAGGRQPLRSEVERQIAHFENDGSALLENDHFHQAFQLATSQAAREAYDLSREPLRIRQRYGMNRFGQSCLLARRLIEAGVRFVTVNTFSTVFNQISWDIHGSGPFTTMDEMRTVVAPMYDRAYSTLIDDLHSRGMLPTTLVCNLAEFGRTPHINAAGGRDHWPDCYTCYFAGGGVRGGQVIGRSDRIGGQVVDRPTEPAEIVATIYHSLGVDPRMLPRDPLARPEPGGCAAKPFISELF